MTGLWITLLALLAPLGLLLLMLLMERVEQEVERSPLSRDAA